MCRPKCALLELAHHGTFAMTLDSERATKSLKKRSLCYILFFYPSFSVVRNSSPNSLLFARMNTEKSWVEWKSQKKRKSFFKVKVAKSKKLFYNFVPSSKKNPKKEICVHHQSFFIHIVFDNCKAEMAQWHQNHEIW